MTWGQRSRHERGYGSRWDKLRLTILERDAYLCQPCRRAGRLTAVVTGRPTDRPNSARVDHVKPKARGGTDDPANLETTCHTCHLAKTAQEGHGRAPTDRGANVDGSPIDAAHHWWG